MYSERGSEGEEGYNAFCKMQGDRHKLILISHLVFASACYRNLLIVPCVALVTRYRKDQVLSPTSRFLDIDVECSHVSTIHVIVECQAVRVRGS